MTTDGITRSGFQSGAQTVLYVQKLEGKGVVTVDLKMWKIGESLNAINVRFLFQNLMTQITGCLWPGGPRGRWNYM